MAEKKPNVEEPKHERELSITRVFDVSAHSLFVACSRPEHMREWFGPKGYPLTLCEMDFRVGGRYRFAMTGPDGQQMTPFGGEYLAIEQDRKISYSNRFELPDAETMVVTITLTEASGKTTLVLHTLFGSVAMKRQHMGMGYEAGVGSGFEQLDALVKSWVS